MILYHLLKKEICFMTPEVKLENDKCNFNYSYSSATEKEPECLPSHIHFHYDEETFTYADIIRDEHRAHWTKGDWTSNSDQMVGFYFLNIVYD